MIRLEGINRNFQVGDETVHALRDINLEIEAGDYLSIMGPAGSGKSTLLNMLGLLDQPNSGRYFLNGIDTTSLSEEKLASARRDHNRFCLPVISSDPPPDGSGEC